MDGLAGRGEERGVRGGGGESGWRVLKRVVGWKLDYWVGRRTTRWLDQSIDLLVAGWVAGLRIKGLVGFDS